MPSILVDSTEEQGIFLVAKYLGDNLDSKQPAGPDSQLVESAGESFSDCCRRLLDELKELQSNKDKDEPIKVELIKAKYNELLVQFSSNYDKFFGQAQDANDVFCFVSNIAHLIKKIPADNIASAVDDLSSRIIAKATKQNMETILQSLVRIYNIQQHGPAQHLLMMKIIKFADANKLHQTLAPVISSQVEQCAKAWNLSVSETCQLYIAVSELLKQSQANAKQTFALQYKTLEIIKQVDQDVYQTYCNVAKEAIVTFVDSLDLFNWDLQDLPMIKQLKDDVKMQGIYLLFDTMLSGKLEQQDESKVVDLLKEFGINEENYRLKTRIMSLLSTAQMNLNKQLSLKDLEQTLGIYGDDLESLILYAIGKELLEASIDQLQGLIVFTKCTSKQWGVEEWKSLQCSLITCRNNINRFVGIAKEQQQYMDSISAQSKH